MKEKKLKLVKKSNIILAKVYCTDDYFSDCTFAVMKITKEVLKDIRAMKSIIDIVKGKDDEDDISNSLYKMSYWSPSWSADFLSNDAMSEEFMAKADNDSEIQYINRMIELTGDLYVETQLMHIYDNGIRFECHIKHTNTKLETAVISFKELGI